MTGGLIAARFTDVPGVSSVFRGGVVSYASEVKFDAARACPRARSSTRPRPRRWRPARAACSGRTSACRSPAWPVRPSRTAQPPGTVFVGVAIGGEVTSHRLSLFGDRKRIRSYATISALDVLRRTLDARTPTA